MLLFHNSVYVHFQLGLHKLLTLDESFALGISFSLSVLCVWYGEDITTWAKKSYRHEEYVLYVMEWHGSRTFQVCKHNKIVIKC